MRRRPSPEFTERIFPTPLNSGIRVVSYVDPEYARRDARAVEDPIAAIFDLAESVDAQTPKIRRVLRYVRAFVSVWLVLDVGLMLLVSSQFGAPAFTLLLFVPIIAFLLAARYVSQSSTRLAFLIVAAVFGGFQVLTFGGAVFLGAVLVALFFLGFLILDLMRDLRSFFDFFALRHRVIQRVREADPVVHVPEGKDAVQRILAHIASTSRDVRAAMALPGGLASPALLTGRSGLTYEFDGYVQARPSNLARILGIGPAGFAIFAKVFEGVPDLGDLQALKRAVEDVSQATRIPPARVLALWSARGDETVTPDVYEFVTKEAARVTVRGATYACSVELVREGTDRTYDFIPFVIEPAMGSGRALTPSAT